ncbi:MAG: hypothetical protein ACR2G0_03025 [Chthoniobacterales bacterium]
MVQSPGSIESGERKPQTIFRYGPSAWLWRMLLAGALLGAAAMLGLGIHLGAPVFFLIALILAAPSLFFGGAVATRIDQTEKDQLRVWTLLFWQRRLTSDQLGRTRLRQQYHDETGSIYAPALWVRVPRGLPIYLDLLATIPDRGAFARTFHLPLREVPGQAQEEAR